MAKMMIIENEYGERALVKKVWFLTFYRFIHVGEWHLFEKWYDSGLSSFTLLDREFEDLKNNGDKKPKKSRNVLREVEI